MHEFLKSLQEDLIIYTRKIDYDCDTRSGLFDQAVTKFDAVLI